MSLLSVNIHHDCITSFVSQVRNKTTAFITYRFDAKYTEILVDTKGDANATVEDFAANLPDTDCRFATIEVKYDKESDSRHKKSLLVLWCPMAAPVKSRMLYASALKSFKTSLGNYGVNSVMECGNRAELTEETLIAKCRKYSAA